MDVTLRFKTARLLRNVQVMFFWFFEFTPIQCNHTQKNNQFTYTNLTSISVDCQWSAWSTSECTASCGGGTLTKERTSKLSEKELAETPSCRHKLVLVESCHTDECPGKLNRTFDIQDINDSTY